MKFDKTKMIKTIGGFGLQILVIASAMLFGQTKAGAQTALEQQCFDAVQGKVAYDQAGHKSWDSANIRKLCQGTTDAGRTVSCFQNQIRQHNDWRRGIDACQPGNTGRRFEIVAANPAPPTNSSANITQPVTGGGAGFGSLLKPTLTGNIPPGCREYDLQIKTGIQDDADSDGDVFVTINGSNGTTGEVNVSNTAFKRNSDDSNSTCKFEQVGAQYVRFDQQKTVADEKKFNAKSQPFAKNTVRLVTINAHDVGTISSVGVRHSSSRYYLMYLRVKSGDELFFPVNNWFTASSPSRTFRPGPEPKSVTYQFKVITGDSYLGGTDANVYVTIEGLDGTKLPEFNLKTYISGRVLERGTTDEFTLTDLPSIDTKKNTGNFVAKVHIRSDNSGGDADWLFNSIEIRADKNSGWQTFRHYDWITKDNSSVTLSYETLTLIDRTITFRNEAGFVAKMFVQYMAETVIGNSRIPIPKFIATPNMPLGQNSTIQLPNIAAGSSIMVFLIGAGTTNDNFFTTQLKSDFTGNQCFKAYNTATVPLGATCN